MTSVVASSPLERAWLPVPTSFAVSFAHLRLRVAHVRATSRELADVLHVRAQAYGLPVQETRTAFDLHSDLYCAYVDERPIATVAMTPTWRGRLDCEEFYPAALLAAFRDRLSSTARFCRVPQAAPRNETLFMSGLALRHQYALGARVLIANCRQDRFNYYRRLGYELVSGTAFLHPVWKTHSVVLVGWDTKVFRGLAPRPCELPDPITRADLEQHIRLCELARSRFPQGAICACAYDVEAPCRFVALRSAEHARALRQHAP